MTWDFRRFVHISTGHTELRTEAALHSPFQSALCRPRLLHAKRSEMLLTCSCQQEGNWGKVPFVDHTNCLHLGGHSPTIQSKSWWHAWSKDQTQPQPPKSDQLESYCVLKPSAVVSQGWTGAGGWPWVPAALLWQLLLRWKPALYNVEETIGRWWKTLVTPKHICVLQDQENLQSSVILPG